jgi:hypothetical protein
VQGRADTAHHAYLTQTSIQWVSGIGALRAVDGMTVCAGSWDSMLPLGLWRGILSLLNLEVGRGAGTHAFSGSSLGAMSHVALSFTSECTTDEPRSCREVTCQWERVVSQRL